MSNADVIRSHYAASDRGDLPGMIAPFAADIRWTEAAGFPYAGTYVGPDAVAANVFGRIAEEWDDYTVAIDEVIDGGDTVVGVGTYSGTYRATGRFMAARVAHVWRLREGEVVAFEQFTDTELVNRAIRD
ncbi:MULTISPECIES: nuclear transport factor 2 family protein [Microbacterium]|uniref:Nuclear transport factor 2 family protein n=1 Tax=Microbacterium resistens TaxID=156977 RepID=A0ABY3RZU1_9MICO|nr:nuclear transport factor 2 family protein [Microbacterium resistens]MBW1640349.1 nuclear transport factor 2 family protein [Microbacterium resistens]MDA4894419.1 nuclear transport factor 2 family protein [Streptomyces sp. MS2A]UGS28177.1 nuclear transport factor 2 family protein [Microbacterium resistens]